MNRGLQYKYAIKEKGLTLGEAAEILEMTRQTLANNLNRADLDYFFEKKLCEKLDLEPITSATTVLQEPPAKYDNSKDDLIKSLKQTIASQHITIDLQAQVIEQLQAKVKSFPAAKSA